MLAGMMRRDSADHREWIFPLLALAMLCGALAGCGELNMVPPEKAEQGFAILTKEGALVVIDREEIDLLHRSARITPGYHTVTLMEPIGWHTGATFSLIAKAGHEYVSMCERDSLLAVTWILRCQIEDKTTGEVVAGADFRCGMVGGCHLITE